MDRLDTQEYKPVHSVVDEIEESLIRSEPKDNASIKVTDNDQVNENTEFLD